MKIEHLLHKHGGRITEIKAVAHSTYKRVASWHYDEPGMMIFKHPNESESQRAFGNEEDVDVMPDEVEAVFAAIQARDGAEETKGEEAA